MQTVTNVYHGVRIAEATRLVPAFAAIIFGMALLYCVGFMTAPAIHNAAHDTRHANGFPCH